MKALIEEPKAEEVSGTIGSPITTLQKCLPDMGKDHIADLVGQLHDMRIYKLEHLRTMITTGGAASLRDTITPHGQRLVQYIMGD